MEQNNKTTTQLNINDYYEFWRQNNIETLDKKAIPTTKSKFFMLSNSVIDDETISWKAKGFYVLAGYLTRINPITDMLVGENLDYKDFAFNAGSEKSKDIKVATQAIEELVGADAISLVQDRKDKFSYKIEIETDGKRNVRFFKVYYLAVKNILDQAKEQNMTMLNTLKLLAVYATLNRFVYRGKDKNAGNAQLGAQSATFIGTKLQMNRKTTAKFRDELADMQAIVTARIANSQDKKKKVLFAMVEDWKNFDSYISFHLGTNHFIVEEDSEIVMEWKNAKQGSETKAPEDNKPVTEIEEPSETRNLVKTTKADESETVAIEYKLRKQDNLPPKDLVQKMLSTSDYKRLDGNLLTKALMNKTFWKNKPVEDVIVIWNDVQQDKLAHDLVIKEKNDLSFDFVPEKWLGMLLKQMENMKDSEWQQILDKAERKRRFEENGLNKLDTLDRVAVPKLTKKTKQGFDCLDRNW